MQKIKIADAKNCRHRLYYLTIAVVKNRKPPTAQFPFADGSNWSVLRLSFVHKGGWGLCLFCSQRGAYVSFVLKVGGAYVMIVKNAYRDMGAY